MLRRGRLRGYPGPAVSTDPAKRALFDELVPLMRRNGIDEDLLARMLEPSWLGQATEENLRFLLEKHRELARSSAENDDLFVRWSARPKD